MITCTFKQAIQTFNIKITQRFLKLVEVIDFNSNNLQKIFDIL